MAHTRAQAGKLLTASELEVFDSSRGDALEPLSAARLRGKVKRARTLRDKYRDLLKRQKIATRERTGSKVGKSGVANVRTAQKADVFAEVLERFEKRLAQVEGNGKGKAGPASATERKRVTAGDARAVKPAPSATGAKTAARGKAAKSAARPASAATQLREALARKRRAASTTPDPGPPDASPKAPAKAMGKMTQSHATSTESPVAKRKQMRLDAGGQTAILGHVKSHERRAQAKRDKRG